MIGHKYAHAVLDHSSWNPTMTGGTGAIAESNADLYGEFIDRSGGWTNLRDANLRDGLRFAWVAASLFRMLNTSAARGRARHFFEFISLRSWMSTTWSATMALSRRFSSSSYFKRTTSGTPMPPNLFHQG